MAGGIDLELARYIAEWHMIHPETRGMDWLDIVEQILHDYRLQEIRLPKNLKNKPMKGYLVVENSHAVEE